jgi:CPA1 family monovalent cation:H+ antiporter
MHSFEYILIMLGAVLISNLISRQFPRVSTPLIQVAIGIALALLPLNFEITLDPELFLALFIAPLLFEDAKKADKPALWRLKRPILLLALGLVFATTLGVGLFIHWLAPLIPLAAAFALAAALAPTDAVAVASLKENSTISEGQSHLLKGESLLNDASSIVSFQFAIAAVLTGAFSLVNASTTFLFMFLGGLAVGVILMALRALLTRWLHASGIENITFHVLFEVITPFLVFLIAEALHVSGIIAVVAAGIAYSFSPRQQSPRNARYNIVSSSVWSVASYSLNGLVFLMLGTQLPYVIRRVWSTSAAADNFLIILIVLILFTILLLRFLWVLVMHRNVDLATGNVEPTVDEKADSKLVAARSLGEPSALADGFGVMDEDERAFTVEQTLSDEREQRETWRKERRERRGKKLAREKAVARSDPRYWALHLHDALLLSLTGAKGAITLAVVLTIPLTLSDGTLFPERDLIIFLASGVILLSLLLLNFIVPLIAPKKAENTRPEHEIDAILDIYRLVINHLLDSMMADQKAVTEEIIQQYYSRIETIKSSNQLVDTKGAEIQRLIIEWEREHTLELVSQEKVSALASIVYLDLLSRSLARIRHRNAIGWELSGFLKQANSLFKKRNEQRRAYKQKYKQMKESRETKRANRKVLRFEVRELTIENYLHVRKKLAEYAKEPDAPTRAISLISLGLERRIARLKNPRELLADARDYEERFLEVESRALEFEREVINEALACNRISYATAKQLRDNVAMMELDIEEQLE